MKKHTFPIAFLSSVMLLSASIPVYASETPIDEEADVFSDDDALATTQTTLVSIRTMSVYDKNGNEMPRKNSSYAYNGALPYVPSRT